MSNNTQRSPQHGGVNGGRPLNGSGSVPSAQPPLPGLFLINTQRSPQQDGVNGGRPLNGSSSAPSTQPPLPGLFLNNTQRSPQQDGVHGGRPLNGSSSVPSAQPTLPGLFLADSFSHTDGRCLNGSRSVPSTQPTLPGLFLADSFSPTGECPLNGSRSVPSTQPTLPGLFLADSFSPTGECPLNGSRSVPSTQPTLPGLFLADSFSPATSAANTLALPPRTSYPDNTACPEAANQGPPRPYSSNTSAQPVTLHTELAFRPRANPLPVPKPSAQPVAHRPLPCGPSSKTHEKLKSKAEGVTHRCKAIMSSPSANWIFRKPQKIVRPAGYFEGYLEKMDAEHDELIMRKNAEFAQDPALNDLINNSTGSSRTTKSLLHPGYALRRNSKAEAEALAFYVKNPSGLVPAAEARVKEELIRLNIAGVRPVNEHRSVKDIPAKMRRSRGHGLAQAIAKIDDYQTNALACHICEVSGNVHECTACCQHFHLECAGKGEDEVLFDESFDGVGNYETRYCDQCKTVLEAMRYICINDGCADVDFCLECGELGEALHQTEKRASTLDDGNATVVQPHKFVRILGNRKTALQAINATGKQAFRCSECDQKRAQTLANQTLGKKRTIEQLRQDGAGAHRKRKAAMESHQEKRRRLNTATQSSVVQKEGT